MDKQKFKNRLKEIFASLEKTHSIEANDTPIKSTKEITQNTANTVEKNEQEPSQETFDKEIFSQQLELLLEEKDTYKKYIFSVVNKLAEKSKQERISHRFDGKLYQTGQGLISLGIDLEETAVFADEVEKLCEAGLDRRSAYIKAKQNLMEK